MSRKRKVYGLVVIINYARRQWRRDHFLIIDAILTVYQDALLGW